MFRVIKNDSRTTVTHSGKIVIQDVRAFLQKKTISLTSTRVLRRLNVRYLPVI